MVASGPLQFAASQHYVEFLYPIVASIPVYLGASADVVEMVLPAVLAGATVVATGILGLESRDWRVAIMSVGFSSGWFAIYLLGLEFHANLFAFPLLLLATALLIRVARNGKASPPVLGVFWVLVVLAGGAHIETTDFFIAAWVLAFVVFGWKTGSSSWRWSSFTIMLGGFATSPLTFAYFQGVSGGFGGQYCAFPPYWLYVFGPAGWLAVLGIGVAVVRFHASATEGYFVRLSLAFSLLAIGIGILGYVSRFPIVLSDRSLLLLPIPLGSSLGTLWIADRFPKVRLISQRRLLTILALVLPLLMAPSVLSYVVLHFRYFAEHGPSFVTCGTN